MQFLNFLTQQELEYVFGSVSSCGYIAQMTEWLWSAGGMIVTAENWSTWSKTCPSADLSTMYPALTGLGSMPGLGS
jgi:hypothetical protein